MGHGYQRTYWSVCVFSYGDRDHRARGEGTDADRRYRPCAPSPPGLANHIVETKEADFDPSNLWTVMSKPLSKC